MSKALDNLVEAQVAPNQFKAIKAIKHVMKSCACLCYAKKEVHKISMLLSQNFFPQDYLIWVLKLDVPEISVNRT